MKKILALIMTLIMMTVFVACGNSGSMSESNDDMGDSQTEQTEQTEQIEGMDDSEVKVDQSKTLNLYYDIFSGPYTLKVETYVKDFENPDKKTVSGGIFTVVDGEKSYSKITSISGGEEIGIEQLFMEGYKYHVDDTYKIITRSPIRSNDKGSTMVMVEEEFYTDLVGEPKMVEVFGEQYYGEHFSAFTESITYCYEGDELKYIITDNGGIDTIVGVIELEKGADNSYFELPEDYEKNF